MSDDQEIFGGLVTEVAPGSLAEKMGIKPGDILYGVNGEPIEDVIDVQFYAAEYTVEVIVQRGEDHLQLSAERDEMQPLGLSFDHPTFDTDVRRCTNLCEFCFVLQMAPRFRRTLYIKDDDYRYSFLFGYFVTLTNLTDHDEWRIVEQALSPLYLSVHDTDHDRRRAYLRNPTAPDVIEQLGWLIKAGIEVHTQIVVTPEVNDGAYLESSIRDLAALYPGVKSVSVVPVGLTTHHKYSMRTHTRAESESTLDQCLALQTEYKAKFGANFLYLTDEWFLVTEREVPPIEEVDGLDLRENGLGMVRHFLNDWAEVQPELTQKPKVKSLTLATGTLFAPTLTRYAAEFAEKSGVKVEVIPMINQRLGETITVAGLLMAKDVIDQLKEHDLGDVVVLPRVMFDHPDGIALDDLSPQDVAVALDTPVALADLMGDLVDIIYGKPALYFDPTGEGLVSPGDIKSDGGWSVEKHL